MTGGVCPRWNSPPQGWNQSTSMSMVQKHSAIALSMLCHNVSLLQQTGTNVRHLHRASGRRRFLPPLFKQLTNSYDLSEYHQ